MNRITGISPTTRYTDGSTCLLQLCMVNPSSLLVHKPSAGTPKVGEPLLVKWSQNGKTTRALLYIEANAIGKTALPDSHPKGDMQPKCCRAFRPFARIETAIEQFHNLCRCVVIGLIETPSAASVTQNKRTYWHMK